MHTRKISLLLKEIYKNLKQRTKRKEEGIDETTMTRKEQQNTTQYYLTVTDIIYGALVGATIPFWFDAFDQNNISSILLVSFVYILIADDWYGAHYVASKHPYTYGLSLLEILGVPMFFLMMFYGLKSTIYISLTISLYGFRGFLWDNWYLKIIKIDTVERKVIGIWMYYALSLVIGFILIFIILFISTPSHQMNFGTVLSIIGIWSMMRIITEIIVRKKKHQYRRGIKGVIT